MRNFLSVQQMDHGRQVVNNNGNPFASFGNVPSLSNRIHYLNSNFLPNDDLFRQAQLNLLGGVDQFNRHLVASQQNTAAHLRDEYMVRKKYMQ